MRTSTQVPRHKNIKPVRRNNTVLRVLGRDLKKPWTWLGDHSGEIMAMAAVPLAVICLTGLGLSLIHALSYPFGLAAPDWGWGWAVPGALLTVALPLSLPVLYARSVYGRSRA